MAVVWLQTGMEKKLTNSTVLTTDIIVWGKINLLRIDDFLFLFNRNNNNPRYLCTPCVPPNLLYTHFT